MKKEVCSCLIFSLIILVQGSILAQYDLDKPSRVVQIEDGLPNHYLRGMVQDAYGFVWIGSFDGLSKFDGKQIEVYRHKAGDSLSLTQNSIISLAADPNNGEVWIGTFSGLNLYQPSTGHFRTFIENDKDSTSLPSNYISWLYVDQQSTLWVGSRSNILCEYDKVYDKFIQYNPEPIELEDPERIAAIEQDKVNDDVIWLGTNGRLFSFNKDQKTFNYDYPTFLGIRQIYAHSSGHLYIRDQSGQISVFDPEIGEIIDQIYPQGDWRFGRMFEKSDDGLWVSCNSGVAQIDTKTNKVSYPWANNPDENKKYEIDMIDQRGRIWVAGTKGIAIYDPAATQFTNNIYETTGASPPFITQRVMEDPNQKAIFLNVSAGNGAQRFDLVTKKWQHIPSPQGYKNRLFGGSDLALLETGELLILERQSLYYLSPDGKSMIEHPVSQKLPEEQQWLNMFLDSKGYIWLGGLSTGVHRINSQTWEVASMTEWLSPCRQPRFRWIFYEDSQEHIWITICGGIAYYSYEEDDFHFFLNDDNSENTFKTPEDFVEDQEGILWVSNEEEGILGAINPLEPKKGIYKKIFFDKNNSSDSIQILKGELDAPLGVSKLAVDRANNLWTISHTGILKIFPDRRRVEIYNELDGLQWLDEELTVPTVNQIETLSSGEIIVAFRKGISIFDPSKLRINQERPQPYLTSFNVYNNPWESDSSLFVTREVDLNYWENYFSFEFSSIGFTNPDQHKYQYKLEGVDDDWVYSGQRSYASYTNIDGGKYTFMVKAANQDGVWNEEPLKIDLSVAIPWWESLWFRGAVLVLLLTGTYAFYRYRMHQVRKAERLKSAFENKLAGVELKALRSQMNPHFIFNCLNSIESYIIKNETVKASEYLNDFSRLIRLILQNSRSNYVTISDELEALALYMDMENLRLRQSFDYDIKLDENLDPDNTEIPPLLMQPYVENAIWHGLMHKKESGTIQIELKKKGEFLLCSIEDNGVGRKRSSELRSKRHKKTSMGMNITQERINIINKAYNTDTSVRIIDLVSPEGDALGTRVELRIMVE